MNSSAIYALISAVLVAFSLSISPEEPTQNKCFIEDKETVEYVGGDGKVVLRGHWHYLTNEEETKNAKAYGPVIIMAHGFGLTQTQGLEKYIVAFQNAGMNVFTFDYATFGQSDGMPRHQVCPKSHIADLRATIEMIQTSSYAVDNTRIGLWGTSLGGGHVLQAASDTSMRLNPSIKAIVSQVPHLTIGLESVILPSLIQSPRDALKGLVFFALGLIKSISYTIFMKKPGYFPLVSLPGSAGMMQNPGDYEGYLRLVEADLNIQNNGWTNAATIVSGLKIVLQYAPLRTVDSVTAPTLFITTEHDTLCPAKFVKQAHMKLSNSEYYEVQGVGHFDIYGGEEFKLVLEKEILFFQKKLGVLS